MRERVAFGLQFREAGVGLGRDDPALQFRSLGLGAGTFAVAGSELTLEGVALLLESRQVLAAFGRDALFKFGLILFVLDILLRLRQFAKNAIPLLGKSLFFLRRGGELAFVVAFHPGRCKACGVAGSDEIFASEGIVVSRGRRGFHRGGGRYTRSGGCRRSRFWHRLNSGAEFRVAGGLRLAFERRSGVGSGHLAREDVAHCAATLEFFRQGLGALGVQSRCRRSGSHFRKQLHDFLPRKPDLGLIAGQDFARENGGNPLVNLVQGNGRLPTRDPVREFAEIELQQSLRIRGAAFEEVLRDATQEIAQFQGHLAAVVSGLRGLGWFLLF